MVPLFRGLSSQSATGRGPRKRGCSGVRGAGLGVRFPISGPVSRSLCAVRSWLSLLSNFVHFIFSHADGSFQFFSPFRCNFCLLIIHTFLGKVEFHSFIPSKRVVCVVLQCHAVTGSVSGTLGTCGTARGFLRAGVHFANQPTETTSGSCWPSPEFVANQVVAVSLVWCLC